MKLIFKTKEELDNSYGKGWEDSTEGGFTFSMCNFLGKEFKVSENDFLSDGSLLLNGYIFDEFTFNIIKITEEDMAKFKKGVVVYCNGEIRTVSSLSDGGSVYFEGGGSKIKDDVYLANPLKIGDLDCYYYGKGETMYIKYASYLYKSTYDGDVDEFMNDNKVAIQRFFFNKIGKNVDDALIDFNKAFSKLKSDIKENILPSTKDLMLTKIIESFGVSITEIADMFENPVVKNTLLNLFTKKI